MLLEAPNVILMQNSGNNNPKVSFCVVGKTEVLPDKFR
jgi:hypothetical protein